jgi:heat-inducible transcriptional repressor
MDLTDRQKKLLRSVIETYIESAEPIGSETIEKGAGLGVSPATIRNEMVKLTALGYLRQPHTSAGRTPTSQAMKFYVDQLMEEKSLSLKDEVAIKEELSEETTTFDKLLRHTTQSLAAQTHSLAVATNEDNDLFSSGFANILDMPEFFDIDITRAVLSMVDKAEVLAQLVSQISPEEQIKILFGDELGVPFLEPCGFVITRYQTPTHSGVLGVIGPNRLNYPTVIPTMRYFSHLLTELVGD